MEDAVQTVPDRATSGASPSSAATSHADSFGLSELGAFKVAEHCGCDPKQKHQIRSTILMYTTFSAGVTNGPLPEMDRFCDVRQPVSSV